MVQPRDGLRILEVLGEGPLSSAQRPRQLLRERLVLPELDEQRLVQEVLHVLMVVERGGRRGALVGAFLVQRFTRIDAYSASVSIRLGRQWQSESEVGLGSHARLTLEDT